MTGLIRGACLMILAASTAVGCGRTDNATSGGSPAPVAPSAEGAKYLLATEPAGARDVVAARKETKNGDDIILVGRIGGSKNPLGKNAIFTVVDLSLSSCPDDEGCPTPWDYCCFQDQLPSATATVKFEDQPGRAVAEDPRKLLGVNNLDLVVVRGKARRDEAGNLVVVGDGLFIREKHSARKK